MTIISCIKQVQDLDIVLKDDWVVGNDGLTIDIDYANRIMNTFDETSLELMLRLKDEMEEVRTKVVTVGGLRSESILRKAMAVGADEALRIEPPFDLDFRPEKTALLLKEAVAGEEETELVLCGRQADNGSNGQTGQILAEMLGWPCLTMVTDIKKIGNEYRISRLTEEGTEHLHAAPPLVVTVTQSENKLLRMATLKAMLTAKKEGIRVLESEEEAPSDESPSYTLEKITINRADKHCVFLEETERSSRTDQLIRILKDRPDNQGD